METTGGFTTWYWDLCPTLSGASPERLLHIECDMHPGRWVPSSSFMMFGFNRSEECKKIFFKNPISHRRERWRWALKDKGDGLSSLCGSG
jgi:hypothetical protein